MVVNVNLNARILCHLLNGSGTVLNACGVTKGGKGEACLGIALCIDAVRAGLIARILKRLLCGCNTSGSVLKVLQIIGTVVLIAVCPVRKKHGARCFFRPVNPLEGNRDKGCGIDCLAKCLTDCNILKRPACRVNLNNRNRGRKTTANLCIFHGIEIGKHLSSAGKACTNGVNLTIFKRIKGGLSFHLLIRYRRGFRSISPPLGIGFERGVGIIEGINDVRTGTIFNMWIIQKATVKRINIKEIGVKHPVYKSLIRINRLSHGNNCRLCGIALSNAFNLVVAIGSGNLVVATLAGEALPCSLKCFPVNIGTVVELGLIGIHNGNNLLA